MQQLADRIARLEQDMWKGNGKPGLTVRVALCEERIDSLKSDIEKIVSDAKAIKLMVLGVILTVLGDIAAHIAVKWW